MKSRNLLSVILILLTLLIIGCKKELNHSLQPELTTNTVSNITPNAAKCGGNIISDGGSPIMARGVCWSTSQNPTIANSHTSDGTGMGYYSSKITGLNPQMTYYIRAYATNSKGYSGYGTVISFIAELLDADSNSYYTTTIGTQTWMTENLKTTKFNDGTPISNVIADTSWTSLTAPAYCVVSTMWRVLFYNWFAVNTGRLCPIGWHVPTDSDWETLIIYLGGASVAGGKLKAMSDSYAYWQIPNTGATDEVYFRATACGCRANNGTLYSLHETGYWWSDNEYNTNSAWCQVMYYTSASIDRTYIDKKFGYSVRCIQD